MKKILASLTVITSFAITGCAAVDEAGTAADRIEADAAEAETAGGSDGSGFTTAQDNAIRSANSYLDTAPFSKKGLIDQLVFEGYERKDARFAANHIKVNWKKQAAASARTYLDMSGFSREGLIEQLQFEGYTAEQAAHGATEAGLG